VHCISISATNTEHRTQPTSDLGHFGTPYSSNRLIKNGSWPRPLKNNVGVWRCGGSHLRVYDVISCERRDKMACNHDIRESENSQEQTEVSDFSLFFIIYFFYYFTYLICSSHLVIDDLPAHTVQTTNTEKCGLILCHIHHVHTISGHQATLRITSHGTSSMSLLIPKTNCVTRPTEHQSQELRRWTHDVASDVGCGLGRTM
jgi:hypothetical protein